MSDDNKALEMIVETSNNVSKLAGCMAQMQASNEEYRGDMKEMRKDIHALRVDLVNTTEKNAQNQAEILKVIGGQSDMRDDISKLRSDHNSLYNQVSILQYSKDTITAIAMKYGGFLALAVVGGWWAFKNSSLGG